MQGRSQDFPSEGNGGGGGGGGRTVPHPGYLHGPLQMGPLQIFGTENGVHNFLALENIFGMSILRICAFSPPEL